MKKFIPLLIGIIVGTLILTGCSTMNVNNYRKNTPELVLEDYFNGKTTAYGVFENRSGEVINQFKVDIIGRVEGDVLIMDEDFVYANGKTEHRHWELKILPNGKYEGTAKGVVGLARGERAGNAFNWTYIFDLEVEDKTYRVKFDDWMFLQENGVMINRAFVTKWGFNVGSVTLSFYKDQ